MISLHLKISRRYQREVIFPIFLIIIHIFTNIKPLCLFTDKSIHFKLKIIPILILSANHFGSFSK